MSSKIRERNWDATLEDIHEEAARWLWDSHSYDQRRSFRSEALAWGYTRPTGNLVDNIVNELGKRAPGIADAALVAATTASDAANARDAAVNTAKTDLSNLGIDGITLDALLALLDDEALWYDNNYTAKKSAVEDIRLDANALRVIPILDTVQSLKVNALNTAEEAEKKLIALGEAKKDLTDLMTVSWWNGSELVDDLFALPDSDVYDWADITDLTIKEDEVKAILRGPNGDYD